MDRPTIEIKTRDSLEKMGYALYALPHDYQVRELLLSLGMKQTRKGFRYLCIAISLAESGMEADGALMKKVAQTTGVKPALVKSDIWNEIRTSKAIWPERWEALMGEQLHERYIAYHLIDALLAWFETHQIVGGYKGANSRPLDEHFFIAI